MLIGTLGASLLGNLLTSRKGIMRAGDGIVRAGLLLPFYPLTNIEIREYYKHEPKFNGVYSRNNLPKAIKKGAYVMSMKIRVRIGFLYLLNQNIPFISIVLVYNIFLKKLINLYVLKNSALPLVIMILKVIYLEYKHMIQLCSDIFV